MFRMTLRPSARRGNRIARHGERRGAADPRPEPRALPPRRRPPAPIAASGTLRIVGSPGADHLTLRLDKHDPAQLQVDVDDGLADFTFALDTFDAIDVATGNGDDTVKIDESHGSFTDLKPTRIDGGNGDDNLNGGKGAETLIGGRGDDVIDGNGGADTAFLGSGDDSFVWDPGATGPTSSRASPASTRWSSTAQAATRSWRQRPTAAG